MYSREIVERDTLNYFKGDSLATNVWIDKYCLKDKDGNLLENTPDDMHRRMAREFARIELKYKNPVSEEEIYSLLKDFKYITPGGSILYGLGNSHSISSLGNCFVIGNSADSYGGILTTDQEQVQLMKRRAGVGHDISHLRSKHTPVSNSAGSSTGAVSFMPRFSNSTREVAQDGRRGALMLSIDVDHPDAGEFIESKNDSTKITGANISVKINDKFMQAVDNDLGDRNMKIWRKIVHQAWKTAEPGVLFIDKIHRESPAACYGKEWLETSTNPCGEIPLCPYDSCRLLSVILPAYVNNPFKKDASFNWTLFKEHVRIAQRLMDDIIDLEEEKINAILAKIDSDSEPEEIKAVERNLWIKIKTKLLQGRRTGLSGVGLADVLAMLGLKYDSDEAADVSEEIYKQLAVEAYRSSIVLAEERGCFPIWDKDLERNNPMLKRIWQNMDQEELYGAMYLSTGRRNIALLTIPPTGTLALMVRIASGVEPVFQPIHKRRRKVNPDNPNKSFQDKNGDWWEEYNVIHYGLSQYIASLDDKTTFIPENTPYTGSSAMEIDPVKKVRMLGRIQKWIDHSISSTTNLPEDCTEQQVSDIYLEAWKAGMKGLTVYRDKCRDGVLISSEDKKQAKSPCFHQNNAPKRPKQLQCNIHFLEKKGFIVLVGMYEDIPYEIFAFNYSGRITESTGLIKKITGGRYNLTDIKGNLLIPDITSEMNQIEEDKTRLISWGLRHGGGLKFLVEQLSKAKNTDVTSFSKAIARVLKGYIKDGVESQDKCPSCGGKLIYQSGCIECAEGCGFSKCG